MSNKISMFDYLFENYGISKSWIASQIGVSRQYFQYAEDRGFTPEEVVAIERAIALKARELQSRAKDLKDFKVPEQLKQRKEAA